MYVFISHNVMKCTCGVDSAKARAQGVVIYEHVCGEHAVRVITARFRNLPTLCVVLTTPQAQVINVI